MELDKSWVPEGYELVLETTPSFENLFDYGITVPYYNVALRRISDKKSVIGVWVMQDVEETYTSWFRKRTRTVRAKVKSPGHLTEQAVKEAAHSVRVGYEAVAPLVEPGVL